MSDAAFRCWIALGRWAWRGKFPTNAELALACGWVTKAGNPAITKAKRALRELEALGLVRRVTIADQGYLRREGIEVRRPVEVYPREAEAGSESPRAQADRDRGDRPLDAYPPGRNRPAPEDSSKTRSGTPRQDAAGAARNEVVSDHRSRTKGPDRGGQGGRVEGPQAIGELLPRSGPAAGATGRPATGMKPVPVHALSVPDGSAVATLARLGPRAPADDRRLAVERLCRRFGPTDKQDLRAEYERVVADVCQGLRDVKGLTLAFRCACGRGVRQPGAVFWATLNRASPLPAQAIA